MKRKIRQSIRSGNRFRREFRQQIRLLIGVTFGFTIAFTWRQTIFDASQSLIKFFADVQGTTTLSILTSILITLISLLLIYLSAHFLKDDPEWH